MGTVAGFPSDDIFNSEEELFEWQPWRSRCLVSIYREEEFCLSSGDTFWVALLYEDRYKRVNTIPTVIWALPIPQPLSNKSLYPKNIISKIILLI
jgi:hypothetical protein